MAAVLAMGLLMAGKGEAQTPSSAPASTSITAPAQPSTTTTAGLGKIGPSAPVTYNNRYEVYGGINFMNFQGGQSLPNRMNLGGAELQGTYWLTKRLGLAADYRFEAGTTPVFANPYANNRPLVYMHIGMLGAQWRGPKNQYVALNYHGFFGVADGTFDYSLKNIPTQFRPTIGLYTNRTKPFAALGASLDFNRSKNLAIRISPELILEHFGTETREFVSVSGGVVYRFGRR